MIEKQNTAVTRLRGERKARQNTKKTLVHITKTDQKRKIHSMRDLICDVMLCLKLRYGYNQCKKPI